MKSNHPRTHSTTQSLYFFFRSRDVDSVRPSFSFLLFFFSSRVNNAFLRGSSFRSSSLSKKPLRSLDFTRRVNRILYLGFAACRPANCFFRVCIGEPVQRRDGGRDGALPPLAIPYPIPRREQGDEFGRYENLGRPLGQERTGQSRTAFELRPCTGCFDKRDRLLSSNNYYTGNRSFPLLNSNRSSSLLASSRLDSTRFLSIPLAPLFGCSFSPSQSLPSLLPMKPFRVFASYLRNTPYTAS